MGTSPNWTVTPRLGVGVPAAANTNRDGTGTIEPVIVGAANGTRVDRVDIVHAGPNAGAPAANCVRLWWVSSGVARLLREIAVPAPTITPAAGTAGFKETVSFEPWGFILPSALDSIGVTVHVFGGAADTYNAIAHGGDL